MSGLVSSLNQAVRSLQAQSRGVDVAGRNLANVNNPDYARQRVLLGERGSVVTPQGAQSLGLEAKAIQQIRDELLDRQVAREIGRAASFQAESEAYARGEALLGENIDRTRTADEIAASGQGLSAVLTGFFNAVQAVAARPTDLGERQNLVQRADLLAERFRVADERLGQLQEDLGAQVDMDVSEANGLLVSIAELNAQIGRFEVNAPGSAADLRDQRQAAVEKLAGLIGAETRASASAPGQLDVFVRDASGSPVVLVERTSVSAPLSAAGNRILAGAAEFAVSGGSIHGLLNARAGAIQTLRDRIDDFAAQLATSVNAAYNPGGVGADFFTWDASAPAVGLRLASGLTASSLRTSATGAAGDNTVALSVSELATKKFSTAEGDLIDGTFSRFYGGVVSDFGRAVSISEGRFDDQKAIEALVREQRQSVSGVSMDEEMADLMKHQRAFQASSRVVALIDDLLNTVVNGLIR